MFDKEQLGKIIRHHREAVGLTQSQLAESIYVSFQAISAWERGITPPDLENVCRLAEFFGVSIDSLVGNFEDNKYYIGIDGDGRKTEFVLFSAKGNVHRKIVLDTCNPNDIGISGCVDVLSSGIDTIVAGGCRVEAVFAGITGGCTGNNAMKINEQLSKKYKPILIFNGTDVANILAFGKDPENSIALSAGTGSVVYVRKNGTEYRLGGWGYLFDKKGSAYDIGNDGITAALCQIDRMGEDTIITELLKRELGTDIDLGLSQIYLKGKKYIAALSSIVFEAESKGDKVAREILSSNVSRLAELISLAKSKYQLQGEIVARGSLFENMRFVELLQERTGEKFFLPELPPVYGACVECMRLSGKALSEGFYSNFAVSYKSKIFV